ncbi:Large ribosomal subunit protein mL41 [Nakaseomyces bracarensis]|uniref:Large ribosomal subunit protein mL41 n=1 Tax=Nakaseomyces bracarensis TaxID=273131 RepID=A0ABR4P0X4_9SACH
MLRPTNVNLFQASRASLLTRPWVKYRDGTLFYGESKAGNNRTALTTKQGNKNMYKGTRSSGIGRHTSRGGYIIEWKKVRTFVTPKDYNLDLKPLVSHNVPELKHQFKGYQGIMDTKLYMDKLKEYVVKGRIQSEASDVDCYVERG